MLPIARSARPPTANDAPMPVPPRGTTQAALCSPASKVHPTTRPPTSTLIAPQKTPDGTILVTRAKHLLTLSTNPATLLCIRPLGNSQDSPYALRAFARGTFDNHFAEPRHATRVCRHLRACKSHPSDAKRVRLHRRPYAWSTWICGSNGVFRTHEPRPYVLLATASRVAECRCEVLYREGNAHIPALNSLRCGDGVVQSAGRSLGSPCHVSRSFLGEHHIPPPAGARRYPFEVIARSVMELAA